MLFIIISTIFAFLLFAIANYSFISYSSFLHSVSLHLDITILVKGHQDNKVASYLFMYCDVIGSEQ